MNAEKKEILVGGQAVIEGVMMRGPEYIATAVRRKDKTIEIKKQSFITITKSNKFFGAPIIRGFVSLIEMLKIGFSSLTFSAQRAMLDEKKSEKYKAKSEFREKLEEYLSFAFAIGLAFGLFAYSPYQLTEWMNLSKESFYFNLVAGIIRVVFFVLYIWIISFLKDVRRVFAYHGAEHKSVHSYEQTQSLDLKKIQSYSTLHPRCGTSFIFFVLLISILLFSIIDTIVVLLWRVPELYVRLGYHLLFIPLISGISYEVLRFSGKNIHHPIVKIMTIPGMALQKITTNQPDDEQIEVSVVALKAALELDLSEHQGIEFISS